ncbi:MAG: RNA methyltransferase, partial [Pseudomonadota bacterium]
MAYAWAAEVDDGVPDAAPLEAAAPASKRELFDLFKHLETELDAAGYFFPAEKRGPMQRNLRVMLTRAALTAQEVQTLRGVVKALAQGRRSARREET